MYCSSNSRLVVLIFVFPVNFSSHEQTAQSRFFGSVIGSRVCTVRIRYFGIHFTLDLKARSETLQREGKVPTLLAPGRGGDVPRSELAPATILSWHPQAQEPRAAPEGISTGEMERGLKCTQIICRGLASDWQESPFGLV